MTEIIEINIISEVFYKLSHANTERTNRMKDKSVCALVLALLVISVAGLACTAIFGFGEGKTLGVGNINRGLDLQGGISILYEAQADSVSKPEMDSALSLIRERLDRKGNTDAEAAVESTNRIRVDIPGVTDAESAIRDIGRTAMLTFRDEDGNVLLDGRHVVNATRDLKQETQGGPTEIVVALEFSSEGQKLFEEATGNNVGRAIIIMLDEDVISAPNVNEKIIGGNAVISGGFNTASADELAALIRAGSLPFALEVIYINNVGAKLGADALTTSLLAGLIGAALVFLFMLIVYRVMGAVADWALLIYVGLVLVVLSALKVTLTLPGIAGIILSVGMAVDANVVIFERVKEEARSGRSFASSVDAGFARALPAILDGNVTTLIAAIILFWLGTGPVKGFAQTLSIGVVVSMFTCLVVTRALLNSISGLGYNKTEQIIGAKKDSDADKPARALKITENRKKFFTISGALLAVGICVIIINGARGAGMFNYDVEFSGGLSMQIDLESEFDSNEVARIVTEVTSQPSPQVQKITGTNRVALKIRSIDQDERIALIEAICERYGISEGNFLISDISASVSGEMQSSALKAIAIACIALLIYVSVRFRNIKTGASCVAAVLHDSLITICCYAVLRIPLNYSFIAVLLTIMGYAINNNIIVFDRVRENRKADKRADIGETIDRSVNQSLVRCVFTTLTTLFTVTCLYILGVPSVKEFALPIMLGLLCGTYTSICNSGSILYVLETKFKKTAKAA